jgi:hypothetical protein
MATHYVARELSALGHNVKQVPPAYAKPFRQGHLRPHLTLVCSTPKSGHQRHYWPSLLWAMCGRLRVGKKNLHGAALVGAAMCSAFECGTHDRWP